MSRLLILLLVLFLLAIHLKSVSEDYSTKPKPPKLMLKPTVAVTKAPTSSPTPTHKKMVVTKRNNPGK